MDKNRNKKIIDKESLHDFVYTTSLAFSLQTLIATFVMFISSSETAAEQSRISSIYATPGFLSKSTLLQFFIAAVLTGIIRHIFMSDLILKIKSIALRISLMFVFEVIMIINGILPLFNQALVFCDQGLNTPFCFFFSLYCS